LALRVGKRLARDRRVAAHVVEHAVEHDIDAAAMGVGRQAAKVFARAVLGRDGLEVERVARLASRLALGSKRSTIT
jgi:hypothetical protein